MPLPRLPAPGPAACALLLAAVVSGCVTSKANFRDYAQDAQRHIAAQDWDRAYRTLEDGLGAKDAATRTLASNLINSRPEIKRAGDASFGPDALAQTFGGFDIHTALAIERQRLDLYSAVASDAELELASQNLRQAYGLAMAARQARLASRQEASGNLIVEETTWRQLPEDQQAAIRAEHQRLVILAPRSVGRVHSTRVVDESSDAVASAARRGSELGQSAYLSQASSHAGLSALGQMRYALVGQLIASWLVDPPKLRYRIEYELRLPDGSLARADRYSKDGAPLAAEQCVYTDELDPAPGYLCDDSLAAFIERARLHRARPESSPAASQAAG
jgi:hypothetical protein